MLLPPFGITLITYIAAGGFMWFVAHLLAPVGYTITLGRGVSTVFVMTMFDVVGQPLLKPVVGDAWLLISLAGSVAIAKSMLGLPWKQSMIAVVLYWVAVIAVYVFFFVLPGQRRRSTRLENPPAFTCAAAAVSSYGSAWVAATDSAEGELNQRELLHL